MKIKVFLVGILLMIASLLLSLSLPSKNAKALTPPEQPGIANLTDYTSFVCSDNYLYGVNTTQITKFILSGDIVDSLPAANIKGILFADDTLIAYTNSDIFMYDEDFTQKNTLPVTDIVQVKISGSFLYILTQTQIYQADFATLTPVSLFTLAAHGLSNPNAIDIAGGTITLSVQNGILNDLHRINASFDGYAFLTNQKINDITTININHQEYFAFTNATGIHLLSKETFDPVASVQCELPTNFVDGKLYNCASIQVCNENEMVILDDYAKRMLHIEFFKGENDRIESRISTLMASFGYDTGRLYHAGNIALSLTEERVVADTKNHRIQVFQKNGSSFVFGSRGSGQGQFESPSFVALDFLGNIWVGENNKIQKFTNTGTWLQTYTVSANIKQLIITSTNTVYALAQNRILNLNPGDTDFNEWKPSGGSAFALAAAEDSLFVLNGTNIKVYSLQAGSESANLTLSETYDTLTLSGMNEVILTKKTVSATKVEVYDFDGTTLTFLGDQTLPYATSVICLNRKTGQFVTVDENLHILKTFTSNFVSNFDHFTHAFNYTEAAYNQTAGKILKTTQNAALFEMPGNISCITMLNANTKLVYLADAGAYHYVFYSARTNGKVISTAGYILKNYTSEVQNTAAAQEIKTWNYNVIVYKYPFTTAGKIELKKLTKGIKMQAVGNASGFADGLLATFYEVQDNDGNYYYVLQSDCLPATDNTATIRSNATIKISDNSHGAQIYKDDGMTIALTSEILSHGHEIYVAKFNAKKNITRIQYINEYGQMVEGFVYTKYVSLNHMSVAMLISFIMMCVSALLLIVLTIYQRRRKNIYNPMLNKKNA